MQDCAFTSSVRLTGGLFVFKTKSTILIHHLVNGDFVG